MIRLPHDKAALVLRAQRLAREQQTLIGSLPSLDWLAQRCGARNSPVVPAVLQELLLVWWRTATTELDRLSGGAGDDGAGLPLLERIAAPTDGTDPDRSLLPLLLQRLSAEQRRLLWHRYLREHPLNPRQVQKVMGLEPEEQQRLEDEALKLLRQAASGKRQGSTGRCDAAAGGGAASIKVRTIGAALPGIGPSDVTGCYQSRREVRPLGSRADPVRVTVHRSAPGRAGRRGHW